MATIWEVCWDGQLCALRIGKGREIEDWFVPETACVFLDGGPMFSFILQIFIGKTPHEMLWFCFAHADNINFWLKAEGSFSVFPFFSILLSCGRAGVRPVSRSRTNPNNQEQTISGAKQILLSLRYCKINSWMSCFSLTRDERFGPAA